MSEWCFALMNDTHIGAYYPGYGAWGYEDESTGEEYFLTRRLRETVQWVNAHKDGPPPIRFVAVLGDLTESAEESEFSKAREILDGLEVPCVPLFGNHDAWPYSSHVAGRGPGGSEVFNRVFADTFARLASSSALSDWAKDTATVAGTPVNNYAFDVEGVHFVALDLVSRNGAPTGVGSEGCGVFHPETKAWLVDHLSGWGAGAPVVLLSHHALGNRMVKPPHVNGFEWAFVRPLLAAGLPGDAGCADIAACLAGRDEVLAAFAGHTHSAELLIGGLPTPPFIWDFDQVGFEPLGATRLQLTEALAAGSNGPAGQDKGTLRVAKVSGGSIDGGTVVGPASPAESRALNPSFDANVIAGQGMFVPHRFTKRTVDFQFDYGDGSTSGEFEGFEGGWWERANLLDTEVHPYTDGKKSHVVTLTVREKTPDGGYFEESISREIFEM